MNPLANPGITAATPPRRLPEWLRLRLPSSATYTQTRRLLDDLDLHTVCESARCPNHWDCWSRGMATFLIGGNRCTRNCRFCAVTFGPPLPIDPGEPARVAEAARRMQLKHVVVTSVARDDLPDGGAEHYRCTIQSLREVSPRIIVEVLTPDFNDQDDALDVVWQARPHVFNHNIETVRRLTPLVRCRATYERSLRVLRKIKERAGNQLVLKSGLMVGFGETAVEVEQAFQDLRRVGCERLTLGQYLQPTRAHLPVTEFVRPEQFQRYAAVAKNMGFSHVAASPLVRSSYRAADAGNPS